MKRLVCFLLVLPASSVWATPAQIPRANFEVIVPAPPFAPGPVTVQLVLYPSWPSGSMRVDITDNESNIYTGPPLYDLTYTNKDPITLDIDLNMPAFDTTMLSTFVDERGNYLGTRIDRYFVSDGSSVEVFDHDPRPVRDYVEEEAKRKRDSAFAVVDSIRAYNDSLRANYKPVWGDWQGPVVTYRDSVGNLVWDSVASAEMLRNPINEADIKRPWEDTTPQPVKPSRDSVLKFIESRREQARQRQSGQIQKAKLTVPERIQELKEKNPVATINETVKSGDTLWVRRKGESDFKPVPPITDMQSHHKQVQDSLAQEAKDNLYEITLDLRKQEDRELVDNLALNLEAMDRDGFYSTSVLRPILLLLKARGVPCGRYPLYPGEKRTNPFRCDSLNVGSIAKPLRRCLPRRYLVGFRVAIWLAFDDLRRPQLAVVSSGLTICPDHATFRPFGLFKDRLRSG